MANIKKILIANRGEIAVRIIRACNDLNIKTVAVYSTEDKNALHTKLADESICIGPPSSIDSYLNMNNIISAAIASKADAIHPGYGFLSENSIFAQKCVDNNIIFIGPSAEIISTMGDKANAREIAKRCGIKCIPGSGVLKNIEDACISAMAIGYPIMIKASAGGGGRGMRLVRNERELSKAFDQCKEESLKFFKNDDLYIEKYLENPRHIEIQILGDANGNVFSFGSRDCSIQRKNQKILEECPAIMLHSRLTDMENAAIRCAKYIGYVGAGTIEFLFHDNDFYFMEMNTRIQVEHSVTEECGYPDIVVEQINIANSKEISAGNFIPKYAIECRINAEDPYNNFMPSAGKITELRIPGGPGIRVDSYIYQDFRISTVYDSLLAKVIASGPTRDIAINRMKRALKEFYIDGPGIKTNIPLHLEILENPNYVKGVFDTSLLDQIIKH